MRSMFSPRLPRIWAFHFLFKDLENVNAVNINSPACWKRSLRRHMLGKGCRVGKLLSNPAAQPKGQTAGWGPSL